MFEEQRSNFGDHMVILTLSKSKKKANFNAFEKLSPRDVAEFKSDEDTESDLRGSKYKTKKKKQFDIFAFNPMVNCTNVDFKFEDVKKLVPELKPLFDENNIESLEELNRLKLTPEQLELKKQLLKEIYYKKDKTNFLQ